MIRNGRNMIYLDHAATTPPDERVIEAMSACMREQWRNPGAVYAGCDGARQALRQARQAVADMLNAEAQAVLFTSGGSEGNTHAVTLARGGHAVVGAVEHASVINAARQLCREVALVPPDPEGRITADAVARALRPDTRLIAVQYANNETGVIHPVAERGALARARRAPLLFYAEDIFGFLSRA